MNVMAAKIGRDDRRFVVLDKPSDWIPWSELFKATASNGKQDVWPFIDPSPDNVNVPTVPPIS